MQQKINNMTQEYISNNKKRFLDELFSLLKIPSVSADMKFKEDVLSAAKFLEQNLIEIGAENVKIYPTEGHPIVYADKIISKDLPTILVYGHYDVQPADPYELWDTDPFSPIVKPTTIHPDGAVFARGACDDKGQMFMHLKAFEAMNKTNTLHCNVKFMLEGEEEVGSANLENFVRNNTQLLKSDVVLVSDTGIINNDTPSICVGLRGLSYVEVEVTGPNRDLHSGLYGGGVANPINILSSMISSLHDENGKVNIPNFYNGVETVSNELKNEWEKLTFSEEKFLNEIGMSKSSGEKGYSLLQKLWGRPTCEINGMWGGYIEEGLKTVIPSKAFAKISFRLVGDQDPEDIRLNFRKKLRNEIPEDFEIKFSNHKGSKATQFPLNDQVINKAQKALNDEWNSNTVFEGGGGSIPIVQHFKNILEMDTLLVGFAQDDDNIHSPNEKYNLNSFYKGARSWVRIIYEISK